MDMEKLLAVGKELGLTGDDLKEWVDREANAAREERALSEDFERCRIELERDILDRQILLAAKRKSELAVEKLDCEIAQFERRLIEIEWGEESIRADARENDGMQVVDSDGAACKIQKEKCFLQPTAEVKGTCEARAGQHLEHGMEACQQRADERAECGTKASQPRAEERAGSAPSEGRFLLVGTWDGSANCKESSESALKESIESSQACFCWNEALQDCPGFSITKKPAGNGGSPLSEGSSSSSTDIDTDTSTFECGTRYTSEPPHTEIDDQNVPRPEIELFTVDEETRINESRRLPNRAEISNIPATEADVPALPKAKRRAANINGQSYSKLEYSRSLYQSQGYKQDCAGRKVADVRRCLQPRESVRTIVREGKGTGEIQRHRLRKNQWYQPSDHGYMKCKFEFWYWIQTIRQFKGVEWKRRKKVKMKANVKRSD